MVTQMQKDHKQIWENCLDVIKDNLSPRSFRTWFEPIVPLKLSDNVLTIQVPSPFFYEYLEEHFIDILRKTLRKEIGSEAKLEYNVIMDNANQLNSPYTVKFPGKGKNNTKNKPVSMPFPENKEIKNPFIIPGLKKVQINSQLNPEYSFSNFIEGECNQLCKSAGLAVSANPGKTAFNPLMFYGESGLGKTHLAQAIGIEIKERFPDKTVLYVTANRFQTQFTEAIRNNTKNDFIHFYQMIDALIIDDVHEFAGKEATQNTFFHLFNHLHQQKKQLILTSDKAPVELKGLENRLLSRFKWGLIADLQAPDFETRVKILKHKTYKDGIELKDEVVQYIAENVTSSVRELEGALISLLAQATLNKKEVTLELARKVIEKIIQNTRKEISVDSIQKVVCEYFDIEVEQVQSKTRKREIVQARQIAMFFAKNLTKCSLASIGAQIGGKDHATVLHACKAVKNMIDTDKKFRMYIDEIEQKLKL